MNIVEKISRVALRYDWGSYISARLISRRICGRRRSRGIRSVRFNRGATPRLLDGKLGNGLLLPIVKHLKILLLKIAHGAPLGVTCHDSHHDEFHVHLKRGRHVAGSHLGRALIGILAGGLTGGSIAALSGTCCGVW